jgi:hypothetical protein
MKFVCEIEMDHAAFHDDPGELARILRQIARAVADGLRVGDTGVSFDANGNRVGFYEVQP